MGHGELVHLTSLVEHDHLDTATQWHIGLCRSCFEHEIEWLNVLNLSGKVFVLNFIFGQTLDPTLGNTTPSDPQIVCKGGYPLYCSPLCGGYSVYCSPLCGGVLRVLLPSLCLWYFAFAISAEIPTFHFQVLAVTNFLFV